MAEKKYNLLSEPWICVMKEDCSITEVSLTNALVHAHEYQALSGELPTQDAAVLRLLLAVLHSVFERVNIKGEQRELENADDALECWEELWEAKRFPEKPLLDYLEKQKERFWLFHPERPFGQVPSAKKGTGYEAAKLNGSLSESSNKLRLFSERSGNTKKYLSYAEAARWLLYVNAFDDTSAKPTKAGKAENDGKLPSPGAGWLGKLGFVYIKGNNLFETLMFNFVLLNHQDEPWPASVPNWELEKAPDKERVEIPLPQDQAALLTLQSRRLLLQERDGQVNGFFLLGGDFFAKENAFTEQMTVWGTIKDKKGNLTGYQPRRHDRARQMWRDFALYDASGGNREPGVVHWNALLQENEVLSRQQMLCLAIASVQYGDKDFFAADVFSDSLTVHLNLFNDLDDAYRTRIQNEIIRCDTIASYIGILADDLFLAAGGDREKKNKPAEKAKEQFYYAIDIPFRKWLATLSTDDQNREEKIELWQKKANKIAYSTAEKMVQDAGRAAFVGKMVEMGKTKEKRYCSSSLAMKWFKINMSKLRR